ncbi:MAG: acetylxylan esterase [Clostridia bacterium]|nr:acetylxylan esterase [Clostridia bacterium]
MKIDENGKIKIVGDECHNSLYQNIVGELSYNPNHDFKAWRKKVYDKIYELLGISEIAKNKCALNYVIESQEKKENYEQIRLVFESETGSYVPCYLLIPNTGKEKYPLAICLQGHTTGMHLSIGEKKYNEDIDTCPDKIGIQAVKNGYASLCIEQRCLGERVSSKAHVAGSHRCEYPSLIAMMLGRTVIGERVWDVMRAIDLMANFNSIDTEKIVITGNSGGGTASFYSACIDERISVCAPCCSFSPYKTSIMPISHCPCNYIPNALKYFEMQDLSCLIAPRKFVVVAGKKDNIFPIEGVKQAYETVEKIFEDAGAKNNCALYVTEEGHFWCEDIMWNAINKATSQLGW